MENLNQGHGLQKLTKTESNQITGGNPIFSPIGIEWFLDWMRVSSENSIHVHEEGESTGFAFGGGSFGGGGSGGSW